jgi:RNA polymerase sigma factor (sigma-70 family)
MQLATAAINSATHPRTTTTLSVDTSERDELIKANFYLVRPIACAVASSYLGTGVELDDLIAYGAKGLLDAASRFDATKGVSFRTFAGHRIRGAIIDGIRTHHWMSRRAYKRLCTERAAELEAAAHGARLNTSRRRRAGRLLSRKTHRTSIDRALRSPRSPQPFGGTRKMGDGHGVLQRHYGDRRTPEGELRQKQEVVPSRSQPRAPRLCPYARRVYPDCGADSSQNCYAQRLC